MTDAREIARLRLAAQRVAGPGLETPAAAVRWLGAMQAQDLPGALVSVALRTAGRSRDAVVAALEAGEVVRSWPMRGTLHLVPAEDLGWMLSLTGERQLRVAAKRREGLGLDDATVGRAQGVAEARLGDGGRLLREELIAAWDDAGLEAKGSRGAHLLSHLAQRGIVCFGPLRADRKPLLVLGEEWIPRPRRLEREEALGAWAEAYLRSHGPATDRDLARWTGLPLGDVRAGIAVARPSLEAIDSGGVEHLMDPATPERLATHRREAKALHLLPGFDEVILGYADRTATLPAEHAERIVPGGNGVFRPTVIDDGRAVGTWKHAGSGTKRRIEAEPFAAAFTAKVEKALPKAYAALP